MHSCAAGARAYDARMANDLINVHVILGSTRKNRFSEKIGKYVFDELQKVSGVRAELVDLRDWPLPFYDEPASPSSTKGPYASELANKWKAKVAEADAYIMIAPEYNHSMPAVLKNALDWVYYEWNNKPVGFVAYGSAMGARSVEHLRQIAVELQMAPIRNAIHLPIDVLRAASGAPAYDASLFAPLRQGPLDRVQGFFDQLLWWARALKPAREAKK